MNSAEEHLVSRGIFGVVKFVDLSEQRLDCETLSACTNVGSLISTALLSGSPLSTIGVGMAGGIVRLVVTWEADNRVELGPQLKAKNYRQ